MANAAEERESATARRNGSGIFLAEEDLDLEKLAVVSNCILALEGLRTGLKGEEDMGIESRRVKRECEVRWRRVKMCES